MAKTKADKHKGFGMMGLEDFDDGNAVPNKMFSENHSKKSLSEAWRMGRIRPWGIGEDSRRKKK